MWWKFFLDQYWNDISYMTKQNRSVWQSKICFLPTFGKLQAQIARMCSLNVQAPFNMLSSCVVLYLCLFFIVYKIHHINFIYHLSLILVSDYKFYHLHTLEKILQYANVGFDIRNYMTLIDLYFWKSLN